ncbi:hypothetical protein QO010_001076 [Caulobacter ginsengisoli]|uniref:Tat pathway signal protein n=1 Tax=Caulobacter ginsengisoli TaxID=400775 RepID=A0ABU0IMT0_9CAUL|nr:hypothetical protein [Caulobacter ginsengisoli]MDQ0463328.1 hypothetical protein [Caulobacter ginsengisoli]
MRRTLIALTLLTTLAAPPMASLAQARGFDPAQCGRIQDVDLPYDVTRAAEGLTFSGKGEVIVVSAQAIRANGRSYAGPEVAAYHERLGRFLTQADAMARQAANPFAGGGAELGRAASGMCEAILDLAASSAVIESRFSGYASPVRIRLK